MMTEQRPRTAEPQSKQRLRREEKISGTTHSYQLPLSLLFPLRSLYLSCASTVRGCPLKDALGIRKMRVSRISSFFKC
jgi:hypothetical protein